MACSARCGPRNQAPRRVLELLKGERLLWYPADKQEYESIGLLGASTTTYDSEGPILATAPFDGITREDVEKVLDRFRGKITQTPPM